MLKNNKLNLIFALLIAICLWIYVMGEVNPTITSTIKNVPITFLNENSLESDDLVLLSVSSETVNVAISGQRSSVTKVKKSDIKVYADLDGYTDGEYTITLKIVVPSSVELANSESQTITVVIDELVTATKPISISLTGDSSDDSEPYIVQISQGEVEVTGAKTLVDSIVTVDAPLEIAKVGTELKAFNVTLVPINKNGDQVEGVTLGTNRISVTAILLNKKTVKLDVPIIGEDEGGADRSITLPKTITIKGSEESLAKVSSVTAESIDVSEIYEDTEITIVPILPDGIEVATDSENLTAKITVKGVESVVFEYTSEAIILEGITEDMAVTLGDMSIRLVVTGKDSVIKGLTADDFYFTADASGLEAGTYTLPLECQYEVEISNLEFGPIDVIVTVEIIDDEEGSEDDGEEDEESTADEEENLPVE